MGAHWDAWGLTPANWKAQTRFEAFSGKASHMVVMNNWDIVSYHGTSAAAQLEAARLNYANGSYHRPAQFGLDGIPA